MKNSGLPYLSVFENVMLSDDFSSANMKTDNFIWFFILAQRLTYAT